MRSLGLTSLLFGLVFCACEPAQLNKLPAAKAGAVTVIIRTQPAGGRVTVDGVTVGAAPQTVALNPGPHRLKAKMSGYFDAEQPLTISGGAKEKSITLTLVASH